MKLQGIEFNNKWYMKLLQIRQKNWKEERKKKRESITKYNWPQGTF